MTRQNAYRSEGSKDREGRQVESSLSSTSKRSVGASGQGRS